MNTSEVVMTLNAGLLRFEPVGAGASVTFQWVQ